MAEILIVIAIIAILFLILLPAVGMVRASSARHTAREVVHQIREALTTYQQDDERHRFPPANGDGSLSVRAIPGGGAGTLALLSAKGLYFGAEQRRDEQSHLLDPWLHPYRYDLVRPVVAQPAGAMRDWNWDPANDRELAWGDRPDPATGVVSAGALRFAYVWSLGAAGSDSDSTTWIYERDGR